MKHVQRFPLKFQVASAILPPDYFRVQNGPLGDEMQLPLCVVARNYHLVFVAVAGRTHEDEILEVHASERAKRQRLWWF